MSLSKNIHDWDQPTYLEDFVREFTKATMEFKPEDWPNITIKVASGNISETTDLDGILVDKDAKTITFQ